MVAYLTREWSEMTNHVLPPWLEKGEHIEAGVLASGYRIATNGYSCGTALDLHQLPPLHPRIRASGSPQWVSGCKCTRWLL